MNSDIPNTPREEMEARVTALLLGELTAEEAAAVRQAIEQDVELARLHERLKRTISLVGEAAASPGAPAVAQPAPLKLSDARREKLLQHFKTVAPTEFSDPPRRDLRWYIPMSIAAAFVALIGAVMWMPRSFVRTERAKFLLPAQTATATEWGIVSGRARNRIDPGSLPSEAPGSIGMQGETAPSFAENGRINPNPVGSFPGVSPSQSAGEAEFRRLSAPAPSRPAPSSGTSANTIFLPTTDELADRSELSAANRATEFSSVATSAGRQENLQKLRNTMLPEVHYDSVPLGEVVRDLQEQARKISPPGVNLIVKSSAEVSPFDPVTGQPLASASPSGPVDLNNVNVRLSPPLRNISLGDALDAVTKVTDKELKLSVGENAVVLSQKDKASPELFTRTFNIDPKALQQLVQTMGIDSGGGLGSGTLGTGIGGGGGLGGGGGGFGGGGGAGGGFTYPRVDLSGGTAQGLGGGGFGGGGGGLGGGGGIPGITWQAPKSDSSAASRQYFNNAGVEFQNNPIGVGGGLGGGLGGGGIASPNVNTPVAAATKPADSGVITQTASNRSGDRSGKLSNVEQTGNQTLSTGLATTLSESKELSDQIAAVTDLVRQPGQSVASVSPPAQDLALSGMLQSPARPDALSRGGGGRGGRSGAGGIDSPIPTAAPTTDESRKAGGMVAEGFGARSNSDELNIVPIRNATADTSRKANFAENKPAGTPAPATIVAGINGTATVSGGDSDRDGAIRQKGVAWFDQSVPKTEALHDFDVGGIDGSKLADVALSKNAERSNEFAKRLIDVDGGAHIDIAALGLPPGAPPQPTVEKLNQAGESKAVADLFSYQTAAPGPASASPNSELLGRSVTSSSGRTASATADGAAASTENFALGLESAKSLYLGDLSEKRGESFGRGFASAPGSGPQGPPPTQMPADSRNLARFQMAPQAQSAAGNTLGVPLTDLLPQLSFSSSTDGRIAEAAPQPPPSNRPSLNESIATFDFTESIPKAPLPTTQGLGEVNRFYAAPVESGASQNVDKRDTDYSFLSPRGTSGERTEERGNPSKPASSPLSDGRAGEVRTLNFSETASPKESAPEAGTVFRMDPQLMRRYGLMPSGGRTVEELNKKASPPGAAGRVAGTVTNEVKTTEELRAKLELVRKSSNLAAPEGAVLPPVASSAPVVEYRFNAASTNSAQQAEPAAVRQSIVLPQQLAELNDEARLSRDPGTRRIVVIADDETANPINQVISARPVEQAAQRGRAPNGGTTTLSAEGLESKTSASSLVQDARKLIEMGFWNDADVKLKQAAAKDPSNQAANYYSNFLGEARKSQESRNREMSDLAGKGIVSTMEPETVRMIERDRLSAKSLQTHYEKLHKDLKALPKDQLSSAIQKSYPDPQLAELLSKQSAAEKQLALDVKVLGQDHPKIGAITALKEDLKAQIEARSDGILDGLNSLATASAARAAEVGRQMAQSRPDFRAKNDVETQQQLFETIKQRLSQETTDAESHKSSPVQIVDLADADSAKGPTLWERLRGTTTRAARIEVAKDTTDIAPLLMGVQDQAIYDPYFIQTEFEKIKSKAVLYKVIEKLNLNESWAKKRGTGEKLSNQEAYNLLLNSVDVHQPRNTSLMEIRVKSGKPDEAARIANTIAEVYRDLRLQQAQRASSNSVQILNAKLAEQEKKLAQAKEELGNLQKASSPEQTTPPESPRDITPRQPAAPAAIPQPEIQSRDNAFSTFSLNVADVSFKLAAASLEKGVMPEPATVRGEEFINALDYRDSEPPPGAPIGFTWERARYPFAHNRDLLRFSVKTAAQGRQPGRPLNLVLLLDNSGSMERADRVRIVREALRVLAGQLQPQDKLSVIAFARTARLWADGVPGAQAGQAVEQISGLTPEGGTNLEDAMNLGYQTALRHYLADGVNRIVLLTDGAANLGNVDSSALKEKVESHRKQGVALDCFGIGWEGLNDDLLEVLSRNGDGRYGFINTPEEAATGFAGQLAGALHVAASDVKVQVEFNPRRVTAYRQIGYAKHQLTKQQFRDNTVDAAEIAAAESGNALYVVETNPNGDGVLAVVRVRYKIPGTVEYREQEWPVPYTGNSVALEQSSPALRLAATASAFSEWLVSSPYAGEVTPDRLLASLSGVPEVYGADARPKKLEWMIRQAKSLAGK